MIKILEHLRCLKERHPWSAKHQLWGRGANYGRSGEIYTNANALIFDNITQKLIDLTPQTSALRPRWCGNGPTAFEHLLLSSFIRSAPEVGWLSGFCQVKNNHLEKSYLTAGHTVTRPGGAAEAAETPGPHPSDNPPKPNPEDWYPGEKRRGREKLAQYGRKGLTYYSVAWSKRRNIHSTCILKNYH